MMSTLCGELGIVMVLEISVSMIETLCPSSLATETVSAWAPAAPRETVNASAI